ncbi:SDR family NAD(P)-dependent oxidoreductase [Falsiroseomonas sp.]|uniref:SDR family NAD(P)-dependent oxidoreductase n=1 Tax=Falsiroseomonas sp. TaxID=2870721 RepID=UPI003F6F0715
MNKLDLQGRVAVVTGGARGIGLAVARRMIQSGAAVSIWDADPAKAEESRAALAADGSVSAQVLDLADELAVAEATAKTLATHGKVDILVNNAGITGGNMPVAEIPPAQWRRVVEVNLTAPFLVSQALVPHLVANGWGRVVNVASVAGKEGNPNAAHYSASKAGLIGLTKSLAKELATKNVLVNCVTPAAAKTDIFNQMTEAHIAFMLSKIPMGRFVEVEEIAGMICWLASPDCSFSTGAIFDISGGRATY